MSPESNGRWSARHCFFVLVFLLFVIYNSNFRWYLSRDSIPARLLPFSLLLDGHLYLDDWVEPYLQGPFAQGAYYLTSARGHLYSVYPIIEPLALTPLYALPAWWLRAQHPPPAKGSFELTCIEDTMEKLSAALVAALSAGVLFLALRKIAAPRTALAITLLYALGTNTWSTSSQNLWRQGFTELSFAILLGALLRDPASSGYGFWAGMALAMAAANNPVYAVFVVLFFAYFARSQRKHLLLFCVPSAVIGGLILFYNVHLFGRLLEAYPNTLQVLPAAKSAMNPAKFPWWDGFAGLLVSPNRGLFIYMPWTVFALWGAARVWKQNLFGWGRYLLLGMLTVYAIHARLGFWWAGGVYGPRYLSDLLPFFALLLIPVWQRIRFSRTVTAVFVVAAVFSLWVQVVGAYFYPNGQWDATPVSIEADPGRVWSWRDMQIMRTWTAGPDRLEILHELPLFAQAVMFESAKPYVRLAIIGYEGERTQRLLEDIRKEPAAQLVAICYANKGSLNRTRLPVPASTKFFAEYRAMLDEAKPDAVFVETPDQRLDVVRECAKRRIDVAAERPMASTAARAREMESLAAAAHIKLMVNYESVWLIASQYTDGRVRGGAVGPVEKVTVREGALGADDTVSAISDVAADAAEWALWLKGTPSRVYAEVPEQGAGPANTAWNDAVILLEYPDATATLSVSRNWPSRDGQVEVFGPKGSFLAMKDAVFFRPAHAAETDENPHGQPVALQLLMHETTSAVAYFVYHIQHELPIEDPVSARIGVGVAEVLDAASESIRTGRAVELPKR